MVLGIQLSPRFIDIEDQEKLFAVILAAKVSLRVEE